MEVSEDCSAPKPNLTLDISAAVEHTFEPSAGTSIFLNTVTGKSASGAVTHKSSNQARKRQRCSHNSVRSEQLDIEVRL